MSERMFTLTMPNGSTFQASRDYLIWRTNELAAQIREAERELHELQFALGLRSIDESFEPIVLTEEEAATLDKIRSGELPKLNVTPRALKAFPPPARGTHD